MKVCKQNLNLKDLFQISEPESNKRYSLQLKLEEFITDFHRLSSFTRNFISYFRTQQQREVTKIMLPCSFHKFFFIKEGDRDFDQWFNVNEKIIRGEQVPYSKRLLKNFDNLREYFQCMTVLNKGTPNSQGEICYGGFATYKSIEFPVRICIKPNQFLYIQGVN